MRCLLTALVAVLAATVALAQAPGQCKPSGRIDEGLRQLNEEYTAVMKETARRVQAGEDRRTVIDWSTRRRNELGVRAIELARADPKDPAAVDALTWVLGHSASRAVVEAQALESSRATTRRATDSRRPATSLRISTTAGRRRPNASSARSWRAIPTAPSRVGPAIAWHRSSRTARGASKSGRITPMPPGDSPR